ncbi:hypothetical protein EC973_007753 [Apophysomyces ossiformis]|uniref:C2 domain-containing protein n=1 Tax=Apophysomyces ossiformis TaxID=679940 RepID=A0A8H7BVJ8_9FUNG|nr:hypothetical protein EC973_007753 [Apophysomyces ossiformis]
MRYFPVARAEKQEDGTIIPPAESNSGVLRFTVHECQGLGGEVRKSGFNLPIPGVGGSDIDAYAIVRANGVEKLRTKTFKRSINPRWDKYFELFVPDKTKMDLNVIIMNNKEFSDDEVIGRWKSSLVAMEEQLAQQDWWTLKDGVGKIHLSAIWKPVPMIGFTESLGRGSYRPPIGVIRVKFFGAKDLKNVETLTGGKSDPYVRILSGMQVRGQTDYVTDNLDPQWNTALYVPVHSIREDLVFEVMDYNDIHKDKTMGITELVLKDVVKEVTQDDGQIIYEALETVERSVELTSSEHKKGRGILHYAASFYPTLALAKKAAEEKKDSKTDQKPEPVADENKEQVAEASEPTKDVEKPEELPEKDLHGELIKYTEDKKIDLLAYESGILSVTIHGAKLLERVKITADILVDSNDPQYRTVQAKGLDLPFNETGDAFVKEMDFSRIVVRLKPVKDDKDDSNLGYWTSSVRDIVRQIQNRDGNEDPVKEYKLLNGDGATVRLSFDFTPVVQFKLDPNESLENQGNLTVTALKATNLPAADRSGTSDPYVVFLMNGEKVHKTEVHKKNLNPVFKNESFTVPVHKRGEAILVAEIYDWDQIGKNTLLGRCEIPFTGDVIESFAAKDVEVPIQDGATLRVRLLWQPQLLARKRTGTSLFSATTRIFTHAPGTAFDVGKEVVGAGFGAGGKVLGAGGKVIGGGVSMIGGGVHAIGGGVSAIGNGIRGIHVFSKKEKIEEHHHYTVTESPATPEPTRSSATDHGSIESSISSGIQGSDNSMNGSGGATIQVTLLEARNLKAMDRGGTSDPYARVRVNGKILHKTRHIKKTLTPSWEESFTTKIGSDRSVLEIMVKDYNKLNDVDIGEANLDVWKSLNNQTSFDGWLPLTPEGTGEVHVRVEVVQESGIAGRVGGFFGMK